MSRPRLIWKLIPWHVASVLVVMLGVAGWVGLGGNATAAMLVGGVVLVLAVALVDFLAIRRLVGHPLESLRRTAAHYAHGRLDRSLPTPATRELAGAIEAINAMQEKLGARIAHVTQQSQERQAVLRAMVEGVVAIDAEERIITVNDAAGRLLGIDPARTRGRTAVEAIRNADLQRMLEQVRSTETSIQSELQMRVGGRSKVFHAEATLLTGNNGDPVGAVLVLHDITRVRQLERHRQEFVANVSHELKTPISAIKAGVETLLEEAGQDVELIGGGRLPAAAARGTVADAELRIDPAAELVDDENEACLRLDRGVAERFLRLIARQANRLNAIVEDLLMLARLDAADGESQLPLESNSIPSVLRNAIETVQAKARSKHIEIELRVDDGLRAEVNPQLLEQAVVNLLDNAVKYSPDGRPVVVAAHAEPPEGEVGGDAGDGHGNGSAGGPVDPTQELGEADLPTRLTIEVIDRGIGIESEHLPRLTERFYRTDKARSREMGGTGLGLAIVKHVLQAHRGRLSVESEPGVGSTFRMHLP